MARLISETGQVVELDVVENESPEWTGQISEWPVEGQTIVDHVRKYPLSFPLSGMISGSEAPGKLETLRGWWRSSALLKYVGRNVARNLVITDLNSTHDVRIRDGFRFRLTLSEVTFAQARLVDLTAPDPAGVPVGVGAQAKDVTDKGRQQALSR